LFIFVGKKISRANPAKGIEAGVRTVERTQNKRRWEVWSRPPIVATL